MYKIVSLAQVANADWNAFVDSSDEAWLWHRYELIKILEKWPGRSDRSFAVLESSTNEILAILPLHLVKSTKVKLISLQTLSSLGGPALKNDLGEKHSQKISDVIMDELVKISKREKVMQIDFFLSPMSPAYRGENYPKVNPLLQIGATNTLTQVYVLDLQIGKQNIWQNFEKRARNAVRKAESLKVTVRSANKTGDLETYYYLHQTTYRRTGVNSHPFEYFEGIWRDFYSKGLAYIIFAELDGEPVAAESFGIYKNAAIYWTGASNEKGLALNANSLLQWTAINHFIDSEIKYYEIGQAFPEEISGKKSGLDHFKRSFGGQLYPYFSGRIISRKMLYALYSFFNTFRKRL